MSERWSYLTVVTGGRDYTNRNVIRSALLALIERAGERRPVLILGGCLTGVDEIARQEWHLMERPYVVAPARWRLGGKIAGPHRNSAMALGTILAGDPYLRPDELLAFPGGNGTRDCRRKCADLGVPIVDVTDE